MEENNWKQEIQSVSGNQNLYRMVMKDHTMNMTKVLKKVRAGFRVQSAHHYTMEHIYITMYKITNENLLYSTGNYTQCSVVT